MDRLACINGKEKWRSEEEFCHDNYEPLSNLEREQMFAQFISADTSSLAAQHGRKNALFHWPAGSVLSDTPLKSLGPGGWEERLARTMLAANETSQQTHLSRALTASRECVSFVGICFPTEPGHQCISVLTLCYCWFLFHY